MTASTSTSSAVVVQRSTFLHAGFGAGPVVFTSATGALLEERRFEPFGAALGSPNLSARELNALNKRTDAATGWSDHGARWLAPETARWLTPDPPVEGPSPTLMFAPWGLHPYQYVDQNPMLYWDPDGREPEPIVSIDFELFSKDPDAFARRYPEQFEMLTAHLTVQAQAEIAAERDGRPLPEVKEVERPGPWGSSWSTRQLDRIQRKFDIDSSKLTSDQRRRAEELGVLPGGRKGMDALRLSPSIDDRERASFFKPVFVPPSSAEVQAWAETDLTSRAGPVRFTPKTATRSAPKPVDRGTRLPADADCLGGRLQ